MAINHHFNSASNRTDSNWSYAMFDWKNAFMGDILQMALLMAGDWNSIKTDDKKKTSQWHVFNEWVAK